MQGFKKKIDAETEKINAMVAEIDLSEKQLMPWEVDVIADLVDNPRICYRDAEIKQVERIYARHF